MGVVLIISGVVIVYCGWRLLLHISGEKINRDSGLWQRRGVSKEDADGLEIANGALFSAFLLFAGVILVFVGVARLFG